MANEKLAELGAKAVKSQVNNLIMGLEGRVNAIVKDIGEDAFRECDGEAADLLLGLAKIGSERRAALRRPPVVNANVN